MMGNEDRERNNFTGKEVEVPRGKVVSNPGLLPCHLEEGHIFSFFIGIFQIT
jgi:hypothetical protein